ncbi:MAG: hypothetical protein ACFCVC_13150 [Acidimicrobiia bacterium]
MDVTPSAPDVPISLGLMQSMPKGELNLHLEGAIPLDTMWLLVQRHDHGGEVPGPEALIERFRYTDFAHFLDTWQWKLRLHRTYEDYGLIGEAVAPDLARNSIDASWAPDTRKRTLHGELDRWIAAIAG